LKVSERVSLRTSGIDFKVILIERNGGTVAD
jgi:hypothetical protein